MLGRSLQAARGAAAASYGWGRHAAPLTVRAVASSTRSLATPVASSGATGGAIAALAAAGAAAGAVALCDDKKRAPRVSDDIDELLASLSRLDAAVNGWSSQRRDPNATTEQRLAAAKVMADRVAERVHMQVLVESAKRVFEAIGPDFDSDKECTDHHYCPFCQLYCKSPCKVAFTHAAKCLDLTAKQYRDEVCAIWWKKLLDCEVDNMEYFHKVAQEMKAEKAAKEEDKQ